jgi:hypothetical protein
MCYPPTPPAENASEDIFDLLIFEPERDEMQNALQLNNATLNVAFFQIPLDFNNAFLQAPIDLL